MYFWKGSQTYMFLLNTKKKWNCFWRSQTHLSSFFSKPSREKLSNFNTDQETSDLIPPLPCSKNKHRSSYFRVKTEGSRKRAARKATVYTAAVSSLRSVKTESRPHCSKEGGKVRGRKNIMFVFLNDYHHILILSSQLQ